ncbi:ATP-binding protein [Arthrobacter agilis]|uniref:ATP-binding protein n=1 Tax=Arthrobacter agilis TaxID=37921 RepID=A0A2L0UGM8_9MICC|nr:ATP-binding protein [Arthrobacter agilis]AUZ88405.1 ATP-binding protein [Arthrobacter agilis]
MSAELYEVTPDPERITESLRDTGYILNTAVADIVDNSLAAGATRVAVELKLDIRGKVRFSVTDNGQGMDRHGLVNALRYGSARRPDPSSLGKFGLGLKTASTSFARRLKLTSSDGTVSPATAIWDLDLVPTQGWQVSVDQTADPLDARQLLDFAESGSGTVVRWENVDRLLRDYKDPTGDRAQAAIAKHAASLRDHLAMVFQRFLDPRDERAQTVEIRLNSDLIEAWNPFGFGADKLLDVRIPVEVDGRTTNMQLKAFVLPRKAEMQADLGDSAPSDARLVNKTQGIFVYRENRLIHGPDWLGMWTQEPHFTLCRAEVSFDHELDRAFQIDIKKSTIVLDTALADVVFKALTPPRREAETRYRDGQRARALKSQNTELHAPSNAAIRDKAQSIPSARVESTDEATGKAEIRNEHGTVKVDFVQSVAGVFVEAVDNLPDGLLYQPAYIGQNPGVRINKAHPYYEKVYVPNQNSGNTIQALDSLLWALASAEFRSSQDSMREVFEDIRYDVSRALKKLVEDLPSPDVDDLE